jgi:carbonic anhydrase
MSWLLSHRLIPAFLIGLCGLCLFATGIVAYAEVNDSGIKIKWGYKGNIGPERWGQLDPRFALCAAGLAQSPVNITKKVTASPHSLTLAYTPAPLDIINDGPTEVQIGDMKTIIYDGHGIEVNFPSLLSSLKETITFDGKTYRLVQFHIHTPSENEWHGQLFPLEIHFVHQGENGQLAVIAVFAKGGKANPELQKIIDNLPQDKAIEHEIAGQSINPIALMPAKKDYYSLMGSLTTPPCSEGVKWIVMTDPITISPAQIIKLKRAVGGANARPVQKLNKRVVNYSVQGMVH